MSWAEVHWKSEILAKETTMQVLIPRVGTSPYATLYLLHSLGNDSYGWLRHDPERRSAMFGRTTHGMS